MLRAEAKQAEAIRLEAARAETMRVELQQAEEIRVLKEQLALLTAVRPTESGVPTHATQMPPPPVEGTTVRPALSHTSEESVVARRAEITERMIANNAQLYAEKARLLEEKMAKEQEILEAESQALLRLGSRASGSARGSERGTASDRTKEWVLAQDKRPARVTFQQLEPRDHYGNIATRALQESVAGCSRQVFGQGVRRDRHSTPAPDGGAPSQVHAPVTDIPIDVPLDLTQANLLARRATPVSLPKFSGDPEEWPLFITSFYETTARCGYSDQENMIRLRDALTGRAHELTRSDLLLPRMVPDVLETLQTAFGRSDKILLAEVKRIRDFPEVNGECLEQLIRFHLLIKGVCSTLSAMGMEKCLHDTYLLTMAIRRMSPGLRREWARHCDANGDEDLTGLNSWLKDEARIAGKVSYEDLLAPAAPTRGKPTTSQPAKPPQRPREHVFVNQDAAPRDMIRTTPSNPVGQCPLCERGHKLAECGAFHKLHRNSRWRIVGDMKICCICLASHGRGCPNETSCGVDSCPLRHHPLLHRYNSPKPHRGPASHTVTTHAEAQSTEEPTEDAEVVLVARTEFPTTLFRIVPVTLHGNGDPVRAYAFIDEGSSVTMMEDGLARQLGLQGEASELCLRWTGNTSRVEKESRRVDLELSSRSNPRRITLKQVRTVRALNLPSQTLDAEQLAVTYNHLAGLPVESYEDATPRILIGLPHWTFCVPLEVVEGLPGEPIATRCRLGWTVNGKLRNGAIEGLQVHVCECQRDKDLHVQIREFFSVENLGTGPTRDVVSSDTQRALSILNRDTRYVEGRYEVRLLWRTDEVHFSDSRPMALRRAKCLATKIGKDPTLRDNLVTQIREYQKKDYIRRLTEDESAQTHLVPARVCGEEPE